MAEKNNFRNFEEDYREASRYVLIRLGIIMVVGGVALATLFYILG